MDMTYWLEYFTIGLSTQMQEVKDNGEVAIKQDLIIAIVKEKKALKDRPLLILQFLLKK